MPHERRAVLPAPVPISTYTTHNMDEAHSYLENAYTKHAASLTGDRKNFRFSFRRADADGLHLDFVEHTLAADCHCDPVDRVLCLSVLHGTVRLVSGRHDVRLQQGQVALYPVTASTRVSWDPVRIAVISLPLALVRRTAAETGGIEEGDLRFDSLSPVTSDRARSWNHFMAFLNRETRSPGSALTEPLVREQLARTAALSLLAVFPNTARGRGPSPTAGYVAPAALRRAVAYIETHADQSVTISQLAAAAGVTPRALQHNFARHYGITPGTYMRRVRLERAHKELQAADPTTGVTVASIAARWGFGKPSRFTELYRHTYNTLPSTTLRT